MNFFAIITFLFFSLAINAQESFLSEAKIDYDIMLNLNGFEEQKGTLFFNKKSSMFVFQSKLRENKVEDKSTDDSSNGIDINISVTDTTKHKIISNRKEKKLYIIVKNHFSNERLIIEEKLHNFNWTLENETKMIGKFSCRKATTNFRGRSYIAWYTNDIPSYFGPMKFGQLPGLILEIHDTEKKIFIQASKVSYPFEKEIKPDLNLPKISKAEYKVLTSKYLDSLQKDFKKRVNKSLSKMGREYNISNVKYETKTKKVEELELEDEN